MIIDSHAYCFQPANAPAGHPDSETHLHWIQGSYSVHHQPAIRLSDRMEVPEATEALDPGGAHDLRNLPDRNLVFDPDEGRVTWEYEGNSFTKYFYPPNIRNGEYTPMSLISEMDYAGVDLTLIHSNPMLGTGNEYSGFLRKCVDRYPDRLRAMAPVEEWAIADRPDKAVERIGYALEQTRLHAVKFNASLAYMGCLDPWDGGPYRPFWEVATAADVPVFFTLGSRPASLRGKSESKDDASGYLDELRILARWMERYPDTVCSITHGFPYRLYRDGDTLVLPEEIWFPFENPRCHIEVCFPVRIGDWFDYPYSAVQPALGQMVENIGANRLLWGTDMPFQNRFCTYRQSRKWIEDYCGFLGDDEISWIMGGTAGRMLGV